MTVLVLAIVAVLILWLALLVVDLLPLKDPAMLRPVLKVLLILACIVYLLRLIGVV